MNIGEPKRVIEIEPASLPVPEFAPASEPSPSGQPAGEPAREPERVQPGP